MSALFEPGEQPEPDLEAGWYWVRPVIGGQWVVSRWTSDAWWPHLEREILEIGPRIPSPDEPPTLLAALAQPARAQAGVAELVALEATWRAEAEELRRGAQHGSGCDVCAQLRGEALGHEDCADALAALNGGE